MKRAFALAALLMIGSLSAFAQTPQPVWTIDTSHSTAEFSVRHMMVSKVKGRFGNVTGTVTGDLAKPETAVVDVTIDASSIDTDNENRDKHLRSADFFEVETYPTITFKSKKIEKAGDGLRMTGELTMHGVTREIVLDVDGPAPPVKAGKSLRSGASARASLQRKDYGLTWNKTLDEGGIAVSDEVGIAIEVELVKKTE
ncbi:MAG TPA: YceI family protein [Thermoanaerobaculia bacterium]|nr:YceI family protein [Thermoanaerobaculia bacterium]